MEGLKREFINTIFELFDGKIAVKDFENWIYRNPSIEDKLGSNDFFELLSFNYNKKHAKQELWDMLERILARFLAEWKGDSEKKSIQGICLTNRGHYEYSKSEQTFNITVGKKYDILSIHYIKDKDIGLYSNYRIIDDESSIYLIPSEILKVEYVEIPEGWIIGENETGTLSIEPQEWNSSIYQGKFSFWEDFHNDVETALIAFVKVLHKLNINIPEIYRYYEYKLILG